MTARTPTEASAFEFGMLLLLGCCFGGLALMVNGVSTILNPPSVVPTPPPRTEAPPPSQVIELKVGTVEPFTMSIPFASVRISDPMIAEVIPQTD